MHCRPRRHHGLRILPKGTFGKKFPVWCPHCSRHIEGRNRSKLWQHCSSQEHRVKWSLAREGASHQKETVLPAQNRLIHEAAEKIIKGPCSGLSLSSSLGRSTRLGGDAWHDVLHFSSSLNLFDRSVWASDLEGECNPPWGYATSCVYAYIYTQVFHPRPWM